MILNQTQLTEMQELLGDNFTMLLDIFLRDSKAQVDQISTVSYTHLTLPTKA